MAAARPRKQPAPDGYGALVGAKRQKASFDDTSLASDSPLTSRSASFGKSSPNNAPYFLRTASARKDARTEAMRLLAKVALCYFFAHVHVACFPTFILLVHGLMCLLCRPSSWRHCHSNWWSRLLSKKLCKPFLSAQTLWSMACALGKLLPAHGSLPSTRKPSQARHLALKQAWPLASH